MVRNIYRPPNDNPQNDHPSALSDAPKGQNLMLDSERYFKTIYNFQISLTLCLNRLDFKNLRLAGVITPISQELQRQFPILSKCDERVLVVRNVIFPQTHPSYTAEACANTTRTVNEIKACRGKLHHGYDIRHRQER